MKINPKKTNCRTFHLLCIDFPKYYIQNLIEKSVIERVGEETEEVHGFSLKGWERNINFNFFYLGLVS